MKWNVLKDVDGKPIRAGYCVFEPSVEESVEEYDSMDKSILDEINAKPVETSDCHKVLLGLNAATATGELKVIIEFLQEKYCG